MEGEGGQLKRKLIFKCFVHEPFTECCVFFLLYYCILVYCVLNTDFHVATSIFHLIFHK